jgi:hypothetical protein
MKPLKNHFVQLKPKNVSSNQLLKYIFGFSCFMMFFGRILMFFKNKLGVTIEL